MAMIRRMVLATALLAVAIGWATSSRAEGALAVGMPDDDPNKGFKWSITVDASDAGADSMKSCRAARSARTAAACKLIGTFHDQCVAVAVNGDPDPAPVSAAGW